ncbi:MAG: nucleotide exchange factor GrpE [Bacteroidales bacterium]|nr:nucleotide exchange factor GrpE [Bacteroidales bacterium]
MTSSEKPEKKQSKSKYAAKQDSKTVHDGKKHAHEHEHEKEKTKAALKANEEKYLELHDKYLRLSAEFDNYRKRTLKERMELIKTAGDELLQRILPVLDNFERALKAMEQANDVESLRNGVTLIYNHFKEFLQQQGIKEINPINETFNFDFHEAVAAIPAPTEEQKGKIVDVVEKGYVLHDKVIRFSKVVVGE